MRRFARAIIAAGLAVPGVVVGQVSPCPAVDSLAPWARVQRAWQSEAGQSWANDSLRRELIRMRDEDQADRRDFGARVGDSAYGRALIRRDSARAARLAEVLDRTGLPGRRLVGAAGADAFMLLVQHDSLLQRRVLALAQASPPGQISPISLAMLEDRVRSNDGQRQRYGSHFTLGPDGTFHLAPVEDPNGLEERRARVGLPPLATYVCLMEEAGMRINRRSLPVR